MAHRRESRRLSRNPAGENSGAALAPRSRQRGNASHPPNSDKPDTIGRSELMMIERASCRHANSGWDTISRELDHRRKDRRALALPKAMRRQSQLAVEWDETTDRRWTRDGSAFHRSGATTRFLPEAFHAWQHPKGRGGPKRRPKCRKATASRGSAFSQTQSIAARMIRFGDSAPLPCRWEFASKHAVPHIDAYAGLSVFPINQRAKIPRPTLNPS